MFPVMRSNIHFIVKNILLIAVFSVVFSSCAQRRGRGNFCLPKEAPFPALNIT